MARDNGPIVPTLAALVMHYLMMNCQGPENAQTPHQIANGLKITPTRTWADLHPGDERAQNLNAQLEILTNLSKKCSVSKEERMRIYRDRLVPESSSYYYYVL